MNLVIVKWEDSHKTDGWYVGHSGECKGTEITSVGWIIKENREAIVIAAHKSNEETPQYCNAMTIPKRSIKKVIQVKE